MDNLKLSLWQYSRPVKSILCTSFFYNFGLCGFLNTLSVFFLRHGGDFSSAFSLSLSYIGLAAFASIFFGFFIGKQISHRYAVAFGLLLCGFSLLFLAFVPGNFMFLGIAGLCVGTGIYVTNNNVVFNRQFEHAIERHQGQQIKYVIINLASVFSFITFSVLARSLPANELFHYAYILLAISMLVGFCGFVFNYQRYIKVAEKQKAHFGVFHFAVMGVIALIFLLIKHYLWVACLAIGLSIFSIVYILRQYFRLKDSGYLLVLTLLLFAGVNFWVGIVIYQIVVPVLAAANHSVHLVPTTILLFNPIVVVLFGYVLVWFYKKYQPSPMYKLQFGLLVNLLSFVSLALALKFFRDADFLIFLLIVNVSLVAITECLIGTTMSVYINQFTHSSHDAILMGILRAMRGATCVFAFLFFAKLTSGVNLASNAWPVGLELGGLIVVSMLGLFLALRFLIGRCRSCK